MFTIVLTTVVITGAFVRNILFRVIRVIRFLINSAGAGAEFRTSITVILS